jgi:hypothetical protein
VTKYLNSTLGVGRDHDQVPPPVPAQAADAHPEQLVQAPAADAPPLPCRPGEDRQLLAQQTVLDRLFGATPDSCAHKRHEEQQGGEHRPGMMPRTRPG